MNEYMKKLDNFLSDLFLKKLPPLPTDWKKTLVKIMPWLALVGVIITLPAVFALLGLGSIFGSMGFYGYRGLGYARVMGGFGIIVLAVNLASMVLIAMAIPGLFKFKLSAWKLLYYAELIAVVATILGGNLGGLIGQAIGLYLLYQVRSEYK